MTVKTRFAPSPTGVLHVGGVRTALFSYLYARRFRGRFVLRIEDTDIERSSEESVEAILEGMAWLGLEHDEGPWFQTERLERYMEVATDWLDKGLAYRCYCTREELEASREERSRQGLNPGYDGRCRDRSDIPAGADSVIRFRVPDEGEVTVHDLVRGDVVIGNKEIEDFVIVRSDGVPTYNFSVVVDDSDMAISHVIRGDDHLINTPKQIHLFNALDVALPQFAHVPMILGADGARLSKRHGAVNVLDFRDLGILPEALLNYLVRLGWSHGDQEIFSLDQMRDLFDLKDVNASESMFDQDKLLWLNQQYIIAADPDRLVPVLAEQLGRSNVTRDEGPDLKDVVIAYQERADTMATMAHAARYCFEDFDDIDAKSAKKQLRPVVLEPLREICSSFADIDDWQNADFVGLITRCAEKFELNMGKLGQPIRVAVTGGSNSPPLDVTLRLIGKERSIARLRHALVLIEKRQAANA
ncbi:MAG: glutamate--tRNA ligase [Pseudomonadota bacterium]